MVYCTEALGNMIAFRWGLIACGHLALAISRGRGTLMTQGSRIFISQRMYLLGQCASQHTAWMVHAKKLFEHWVLHAVLWRTVAPN